jgi:hypothetical protein
MGTGPNTKAFFELNFEPKLHHSIKNHEQNVEELSKTLKILTAKGLENYQKLKENQYDSVNKNRILKTFSKGDIQGATGKSRRYSILNYSFNFCLSKLHFCTVVAYNIVCDINMLLGHYHTPKVHRK